MSSHLTDAAVARLPPPMRGSKITPDDSVKGFGVRVTAAGARSYILRYRVRGTGRERTFTIGNADVWRCTDARAEAKRLKREVDGGADPVGDIEAEREAPTVADLIERFEKEHLSRKTASTAVDYRCSLRKWIAPHFGQHVKVTDVTYIDIDRLHRKITADGSPYQANRVHAIVSKMFSLAVHWRMRGDNPCKGIERNIEHHRQRYLSADELARLVATLAAHKDQQATNIIRLLLLTGARRGEVLGMRWADVDLTNAIWSKPPSSTKQKKAHQVPLSGPARQLLSDIAERYTRERPKKPLPEFVFAGSGGTGHVVELKRAWKSITKAADITDLRIHDLRHSYASQVISGGASLALVGALLGHSNPSTTARYAHLHHDPMREATERVGAVIVNAGKTSETPVIPLTRRGRS